MTVILGVMHVVLGFLWLRMIIRVRHNVIERGVVLQHLVRIQSEQTAEGLLKTRRAIVTLQNRLRQKLAVRAVARLRALQS